MLVNIAKTINKIFKNSTDRPDKKKQLIITLYYSRKATMPNIWVQSDKVLSWGIQDERNYFIFFLIREFRSKCNHKCIEGMH